MKVGIVHFSAIRGLRGLLLALAVLSISSFGLCQSPIAKPPLVIKVERQTDIRVRPGNVRDLTESELSRLRKALEQDLGETFAIVPQTDETHRGELDVLIMKVTTPPQVLYVASSAIIVGKEKSRLLLAHSVMIQSSLQRVAQEIVSQMSRANAGSQFLSMASPALRMEDAKATFHSER